MSFEEPEPIYLGVNSFESSLAHQNFIFYPEAKSTSENEFKCIIEISSFKSSQSGILLIQPKDAFVDSTDDDLPWQPLVMDLKKLRNCWSCTQGKPIVTDQSLGWIYELEAGDDGEVEAVVICQRYDWSVSKLLTKVS